VLLCSLVCLWWRPLTLTLALTLTRIGCTGFGVPMVELHAETMGGGLQITSMPGQSTAALIRMARRGDTEW